MSESDRLVTRQRCAGHLRLTQEGALAMPLSRHEQEVLDAIETGLQVDDPDFSARLSFGTENRYQRRQTLLAHGCLWLGMVLTLTGFGLVHQALAAGVLLIVYGAGILIGHLEAGPAEGGPFGEETDRLELALVAVSGRLRNR